MESNGVEEVLEGFLDWLGQQRPDTCYEVVSHTVPSAGYSGDTFLVDVRRCDDQGTIDEQLALKVEPLGPALFPQYDFRCQARVQTAVAARGIPAPAPATAELDPCWIGRPFLVMPAIAGHIVGELAVRDPWIIDAPMELAQTAQLNYIDTIADINLIDWRSAGLVDAVPSRDNLAEIDYWRRFLDWYGGGVVLVPSLVDALNWCDANRPADEPEPSLLWGDVRLGNVIFDECRSPVAVIDWEMATIGSAEHDLAWTLVLQDTQDKLFRKTVPGFVDRAAFVARYEQRLGRPVRDLAWYEVLAMVRSCALFARITHLHEAAGLPTPLPIADNPVLTLLQHRIADFRTAS